MLEKKDDMNGGRARRIRERHRRRTMWERYALVTVVGVLAVAAVILALKLVTSGNSDGKKNDNSQLLTSVENTGAVETEASGNGNVSDDQGTGTVISSSEPQTDSAVASAIEEAKRLAASYDYDEAVSRLESIRSKDESGEVEKLLAEIADVKKTLVDADITAIPHIFFHSLIVDTSLAFHNDKARGEDYNRVMTTVDEFNKMMQQMYDKDYVLVSLHQKNLFPIITVLLNSSAE